MAVDHQDLAGIVRLNGPGEPVSLCPSAQRTLDWALAAIGHYGDSDAGELLADGRRAPQAHATLRIAIAYLLTGDVRRANEMLRLTIPSPSVFNTPILVIALKQLGPVLDAETRGLMLEAIRVTDTTYSEDIISGRNNNIPLLCWCTRITQGVLFGAADLLAAGVDALERLTELVEAHGTLPEYNSPTYNAVTMLSLRAIGLLGEERTAALAGRLERHLWTEMAWRHHPRLRELCGPWGRAYHDSVVGGSGLVSSMLHVVWDALYDPQPAYDYMHGLDILHGAVFPLMMQDFPIDLADLALAKEYPLAVVASCEQVQRKMGDEAHRTWVPGAIAELTTWMDEHLSVGTTTRVHVHGLQSNPYVAVWTRTGRRVETLNDLGHAVTRFAINGRRPGDLVSTFHHHQGGTNVTFDKSLWGDDGRAAVIQSGPTALAIYVPKAQERWNIRTMEMMMAFPRLDTIDAVLVDGVSVEEYEGGHGASVVVRSGNAALGLRFAVCDPSLVQPRLFVEHAHDHLLVGLRLVDFDEERVVSDDDYLRLAGSIGAELRYAPSDEDVAALVRDMREAEIADSWEMAMFGGHRQASFRVGEKRLYARYDPIGDCFLRRIVPPHPGRTVRIAMEAPTP